MRTKLATVALGLGGLVGMALVGPASVAAADDPCATIEHACKAAGFAIGQHDKGKGLGADCMQPIIGGKTVSGVTVDPAVAQACRAERAKAKSGHPQQ